jgi:methionyl-tRNA formyltransferase
VAAELAQQAGWSVSLRTSQRLFSEDVPWARTLRARQVPIVVETKLSEAMSAGPAQQRGDIGLSFGAPWIFTHEWLAPWDGFIFNVHGRPLPRHRGAGGASWLIMMQEREGMAAIHELTAGIDEGPIVASERFTYPPQAVLPLHFDEEDCRRTEALLRLWLPQAFSGKVERRSQGEDEATYWPRLSTKVHGWIDWSWTAQEIASFCRAFDQPYEGAKTFVRGAEIALRNAEIVDLRPHHPFQAGLIFRVQDGSADVAARNGSLRFTPARRVRLGDRFITPAAVLEQALASRISYLPSGAIKLEDMGPGPAGSS